MDLFFFPHSVYPTLFIILFSPRRVSWLLQLDAHCGSDPERDTVIRDAPQFRLFCSLRALCAATLFSQHSSRASVYDIDVKDAPFSLLTLVVWWILCDFSPRFSNLFFFFFFYESCRRLRAFISPIPNVLFFSFLFKDLFHNVVVMAGWGNWPSSSEVLWLACCCCCVYQKVNGPQPGHHHASHNVVDSVLYVVVVVVSGGGATH